MLCLQEVWYKGFCFQQQYPGEVFSRLRGSAPMWAACPPYALLRLAECFKPNERPSPPLHGSLPATLPPFQTGWFPVNYVAISNRARPAAATPPSVPTTSTAGGAAPAAAAAATAAPATVQGLPASNVPASTSKAARPDNFWQQPFSAGGSGGGAGGGGGRSNSRSSLPSALPPGVSGGGRGGGGGASGGVEMVKALFDYVAQVRRDQFNRVLRSAVIVCVSVGSLGNVDDKTK